MQGEPRHILDLRFDRFEELRRVAFENGDRDAIAIEHAVAGKRWKLRPRREDAGEVQWIGA
jgi:hypothetical protein